ncbi:BREX-2 system phosphatase PglZ [Luteipulveratus mongoliensis]|nr:BREX-2 system phosphatase PglZ [Luteipulveratus mongoliensis]
MAASTVSQSMLFEMIDMVRSKGYEHGVVGVLADPGHVVQADVEHRGQKVRVRPAESALAVREALRENVIGDWLVIVTNSTDADLGSGILSHVIGHRLRRPDPWEAIRQAFSATGISANLMNHPGRRDLAAALVAAKPADGWPAAPAGVLTRGHAMSSVARAHLGLAGEIVDAVTVLSWSVRPDAGPALNSLRSSYGDALANVMVDWIASRAGASEEPVRKLLEAGSVGDLVPLGLAVSAMNAEGLTTEELQTAQLARVRLEQQLGKPLPLREALGAYGAAAAAVAGELVQSERHGVQISRLLKRADEHLIDLEAAPLAVHSDILRSGLRQRLVLLADALLRGVALAQAGQPTDEASAVIESGWVSCQRHVLARTSSREVSAFGSAVRLWRWLASPDVDGDADLGARARAHINDGAWADNAINDVYTGVDDKGLSTALNALFVAATERRDREERAFAAQLAVVTDQDSDGEMSVSSVDGPVWNLEAVLERVVIPAAKRTRVLFLVMDGMSAAAATEIVADLTETSGWVEAGATADTKRRGAALAVLPSLTEFSRASLLCGTLTRGGQDVERTGYAALTEKSAKINARLFHKKGIDTTQPGALLAGGVGAAIDDIDTQLVTVVLNTIDDALDRSDPVRTTWTADAVKHLSPILARARDAGRTVVMTADHGHVVERRGGTQRSASEITSGRSRDMSPPVQDDEVAVSGRRVLTDDHQAVLAVSEGLRYGPLKAGYHGGASAQEVVVPLIVLLPEPEVNDLDLPPLSPQTPTWWSMAERINVPVQPVIGAQPSMKPSKKKPAVQDSSLFDDQPRENEIGTTATSLGLRVVASAVYAEQRNLLGRLAIRDDQAVSIIDALAGATGLRLPRAVVATVLGVPAFRVDGALSQVRQLLNIEGYNVVRVDSDGQTVILDEQLLRDQFEVP